MKTKVFVDGEAGTTGLQINERLNARNDIEFIKIAPELRKDTKERSRLLNEADIAFLCLPDVASREAVSLVTNDTTRIIDASTAFRTDDSWAYGFPELDRGQRERIRTAKRVSVPGCHATGFNAAVHPLIAGGILPTDYPICCQSVSGYSGAGKKLIAEYEEERADDPVMRSPRYYALALRHKHLPEMIKINNLAYEPVFTPLVGPYYKGMIVSIPLHRRLLARDIDAQGVHEYFKEYYKGEKYIDVMPFEADGCLDSGFLGAMGCNGTNKLEIYVFGHDDQILVVSRLDNLGKGASGAAVQCMNIMLGIEE